jgi:hypothetical protein
MSLKFPKSVNCAVYLVMFSTLIVLGLPFVLGGTSLSTLHSEAYAQGSGEVTVAEMVLSMGIFKRQPVGPTTQVSLEQGRIYTWTRIKAQNPPTSIKHVYYHLGKKIVEVPLEINASSYRTWSYKSLPGTWALGQWRVEVLSADGTLLASKDFTVVR